MTAHLQHSQPILTSVSTDYAHEILAQAPANPTAIKPGSLIYLWAPGEIPQVDRPVLARVERTTMDTIMARDLASGARGKYEVGAIYPAQLRWNWELAAPPERATLVHGTIEVVNRSGMPLDERKQLLFGEPGTTVRVSTKDGQSYVGVVTCMVIDGTEDKVAWVFMDGPTDSRGPIRYKLRFEDISAVIEGGGR